MFKTIPALLLLSAATLFGMAPTDSISCWDMCEIALEDSGWSNPFKDVRLDGVFTAPSGTEYRVEGFYDGDGDGGTTGNVFRLRFAPSEEGDWTWRTESNREALNGISGRFAVSVDGNRGPLRYDPALPHWLHWADGSVFFEAGAGDPECFLANAFITQQQRYKGIDYLAQRGVTSLYMGVVNAGPGDGTPEMKVTPWTGGFDKPNFDDICLDFMNRLDGVVRRLAKNGMVAHIVLYLDDCCEISNAITGEQEEMLIRYLCARFGSYCGVVWNLAEEYEECFTDDWCRSRAAMFRKYDPLGHPVTVHQLTNDKFTFAGDTVFTTTAMQFNWTAPDSLNTMIRGLRAQTAGAGHPLPATLTEWTPIGPSETETARKGMWSIALGGGSFQVFNKDDDGQMTAEFQLWHKIWQFAYIVRHTMEALPLDDMVPDNSLVTSGFCLAQPGRHYLVYLPDGGDVTITVDGTGLTARWLNPRTGREKKAGEVAAGQVSFSAPEEGDWALLIE